MIGAVFVVLVGVVAWLVLRQPKPGPTAAVREVAGRAPGGSLEKATAFFQEGKIPETLAELKRIRPSDPDYAKAKQLLETLSRPTGDAPPPPAGGAAAGAPASSDATDPAPIRTRAERALGEKRYIDALKDFSAVASAFQGDPAFAQSMAAASEHVAELTPAVKLYNEGEYETAIPVLWRIYQADKGNQDARSYLLRCYTTRGSRSSRTGSIRKRTVLRRGAGARSRGHGDPEAPQFAERYQKGDLDLLGPHLRAAPLAPALSSNFPARPSPDALAEFPAPRRGAPRRRDGRGGRTASGEPSPGPSPSRRSGPARPRSPRIFPVPRSRSRSR